ncbi:MAG: hypothetical protein GC184_06705 [Rhizobiales bacterium]|nr:hypothetical protein [Hyphomicrobiales bacterium]
MKDLHHNIKTILTLDPAVTTASRSGAPVDGRGFQAVEHVACFGASGDTLSGSDYFELKLEASSDAANWSPVNEATHVLGGPVSEAGVFATIDDVSGDQTDYRIGYVGPARYSRLVLVVTGTHDNGTPVSALAILAAAHVKPVV